MLSDVLKQIKISLLMLGMLSIITGLLYPALTTVLAQTFFSWKANGSLIKQEDKVIGSLLLGQEFHAAKYFWGRPSATKGTAYNAMSSGGSNYSPSNPEYIKIVTQRVAALRQANPEAMASVPIDLVTASASGLDPHISLIAAYYQAPRVAKARKMNVEELRTLIGEQTKALLPIFEQQYVNVLQLNLALDQMSAKGVIR